MRESIGTAHSSLQSGPFDLLAEAVWIDHQDRILDEDFSHRSAYLQAGLRRGEFVPYLRYDVRSMERDDPFFTGLGLGLDRWEGLLGLRYEPGEHVAMKIEGGYGRGEERDGLGAVEQRSFKAASARR